MKKIKEIVLYDDTENYKKCGQNIKPFSFDQKSSDET